MRPRYKVTGCARFFLFFIIFVPIVYFGAAYFRGENGVQKIKDTYHDIVGGKKAVGAEEGEDENMELLEQQLKEAREKIKELETELAKEKAKNQ